MSCGSDSVTGKEQVTTTTTTTNLAIFFFEFVLRGLRLGRCIGSSKSSASMLLVTNPTSGILSEWTRLRYDENMASWMSSR